MHKITEEDKINGVIYDAPEEETAKEANKENPVIIEQEKQDLIESKINAQYKPLKISVKQINMGKLSSAILQKNDDIEKLATIARSSTYWAKREQVFEEVNKDGGEYLSLSTINNELVELMKMGVLDRAKPPKNRHFGYFIMSLYWDEAVKLLLPSEINDPIYKGESVEIINPITGQTEKI